MKPHPFTCRSDCVEHLMPFGIPSGMILTPKTTFLSRSLYIYAIIYAGMHFKIFIVTKQKKLHLRNFELTCGR